MICVCELVVQSLYRSLNILDFSNVINKSSLERIAEADDYEVVKSVQVNYI